MVNQQTLIIGASSGIAQSLAVKVVSSPNTRLILVSRDLSEVMLNQDLQNQEVSLIQVEDYDAESISKAIDKINAESPLPITQVYICNGLLHSQTIKPEKRLEDFDADSFMQVIKANSLTPLLWIQGLVPILTGKFECKLTVFSARVGSISDNQLGGWYSYRASKAALNMMLKNVAIEVARRAKNIKVIVFHPGTTDTGLSKPFQSNVPANKLFTPDYVAQQLMDIVANTPLDAQASFLDWKGQDIVW